MLSSKVIDTSFCILGKDKSISTKARMLRRLLLGQPRREEIKDAKKPETYDAEERYVVLFKCF